MESVSWSVAAAVVLIVMSLSKRRKVHTEGRIFQDRWKEKYFFWEVGGKPVCLICSQQVAVVKEYNIKRHYETHAEKYGEYTGQLRTQKLNELASSLQKQQLQMSGVTNSYWIFKHMAYCWTTLFWRLLSVTRLGLL